MSGSGQQAGEAIAYNIQSAPRRAKRAPAPAPFKSPTAASTAAKSPLAARRNYRHSNAPPTPSFEGSQSPSSTPGGSAFSSMERAAYKPLLPHAAHYPASPMMSPMVSPSIPRSRGHARTLSHTSTSKQASGASSPVPGYARAQRRPVPICADSPSQNFRPGITLTKPTTDTEGHWADMGGLQSPRNRLAVMQTTLTPKLEFEGDVNYENIRRVMEKATLTQVCIFLLPDFTRLVRILGLRSYEDLIRYCIHEPEFQTSLQGVRDTTRKSRKLSKQPDCGAARCSAVAHIGGYCDKHSVTTHRAISADMIQLKLWDPPREEYRLLDGELPRAPAEGGPVLFKIKISLLVSERSTHKDMMRTAKHNVPRKMDLQRTFSTMMLDGGAGQGGLYKVGMLKKKEKTGMFSTWVHRHCSVNKSRLQLSRKSAATEYELEMNLSWITSVYIPEKRPASFHITFNDPRSERSNVVQVLRLLAPTEESCLEWVKTLFRFRPQLMGGGSQSNSKHGSSAQSSRISSHSAEHSRSMGSYDTRHIQHDVDTDDEEDEVDLRRAQAFGASAEKSLGEIVDQWRELRIKCGEMSRVSTMMRAELSKAEHFRSFVKLQKEEHRDYARKTEAEMIELRAEKKAREDEVARVRAGGSNNERALMKLREELKEVQAALNRKNKQYKKDTEEHKEYVWKKEQELRKSWADIKRNGEEVSMLQRKQKRNEEEIKTFREEKTRLEGELGMLRNESQITVEYYNLRAALSGKQEEYVVLLEEKLAEKEKARIAEEENSRLAREMDNQREELVKLKKEVKDLREERVGRQEEVTKLKQASFHMTGELQTTKEALKVKEGEAWDHKKAIQRLEGEVATLKKDKERREEELAKISEEAEKLRVSTEEAVHLSETAMFQYEEAMTIKRVLEDTVQRQTVYIDQLETSVGKSELELVGQNDMLMIQVSTLSQRNRNLEERVATLLQERDDR